MSVVVYKCPSCGAAIAFDPEQQKWLCKFCGSAFEKDFQPEQVEESEKEEQIEENQKPEWTKRPDSETDFEEPADSDKREFAQKIETYVCPDCGAQIMTDETTAATFCAFCHNPTIIKSRLSSVYKPNKIIPFKIGRDKALSLFRKALKKRLLLPKIFKSDAQFAKLTGMYVPFWLYDCDAWGGFHAKGTQVSSYRSGQYMVTVTRHYHIIREGLASFSGVPADASKKMDNALMDQLEPYRYEEMEDFDLAYLSGFIAEKYDEDAKEVRPRVEQKIETSMQNLLQGTVKGFSTVTPLHQDHRFIKLKPEYALLPVWMLSCQYKGKNYIYAINGQTGRMVGSLPVNIVKGLLLSLAIFAGTLILCMLGGLLWA